MAGGLATGAAAAGFRPLRSVQSAVLTAGPQAEQILRVVLADSARRLASPIPWNSPPGSCVWTLAVYPMARMRSSSA